MAEKNQSLLNFYDTCITAEVQYSPCPSVTPTHTSHSFLFTEGIGPSLLNLSLYRSLPTMLLATLVTPIYTFSCKMVKLEDQNCMQCSLCGSNIYQNWFCLLFSHSSCFLQAGEEGSSGLNDHVNVSNILTAAEVLKHVF